MLTSIVAAVAILGVLIVVHEAGHFTMAKRLGVRVLRFSIGYPPKIWGLRRGETEYVIGATPLGGYVRMLGDEVGEDPKSEELTVFLTEIGYDLVGAARETGALTGESDIDADLATLAHRLAAETDVSHGAAAANAALGRALKPEENLLLSRIRMNGSAEEARKSLAGNPPAGLQAAFRARAFPTQKLWRRFAIVLAGPIANILFAPILLMVVFMYGVPALLPIVGQVKAGMPAATAGLQQGDKIVAVGGMPTTTWIDFSSLVKASGGQPVKLEIERPQAAGASQRLTLTIAPTQEDEKTVYGTTVKQWIIGVMPRGDEITRRDDPFHAAYKAVITSVAMSGELVTGLASIVSGATPVRQALGGPIMIAQMAGREAHEGFANVAMFTVMLSLELGLINLLPVPLLDGGHLAFFAFEGLRGKPLAVRHREIALQVGLFLLVALMAFVIFNDITRIVQG